jgi:hypothetical protein
MSTPEGVSYNTRHPVEVRDDLDYLGADADMSF